MLKREDGRLRLLTEEDLDMVLAWRNSDRIRSVMYSDHIITPGEHKRWFDRLEQTSSAVHLIFEFNSRPIGTVYYTDIDTVNRKCFWGFYLGEEGLPYGIGMLMGILGLEYAFVTLQIRKLCGETFAFNTRGVEFFRKLGFRQEGLFQKHVLKNDKYEDVILYALLDDEWKKSLTHLEKLFLS
jgi:UDP-4-amino-4,6-dideoxy-N-acetyl-beta-L-altrosamine N-acetyltransferase